MNNQRFIIENPNIFKKKKSANEMSLSLINKKSSHKFRIWLLNKQEIIGAEELIIQHLSNNEENIPNQR